jgi:16S rRNA C967 or C1407 C5-methylase (RsmB/RsmF family)/NOL1/NOP2/fmu family ribosome biogenesis protein
MDLPAAFAAQMEARLGEEWSALVAALNRPAPTSIRLNPSKGLAAPPGAVPVPWAAQGYYLPERPSFTLDPALHAGAYYVQEASSMLVHEAVRQLVPAKPVRALDLCAAPGGKSTLLQAALPSGSWLLANEVIRARYQILRENLIKWGAPNVASSSLDSSRFGKLAGYFDLVLVDAPCSGEGLFRKDPAAAEHWSPANVQLCAGRQRRILAEAVSLLAPGGLLLYCTCTYNQDENECNAAWLASSFDLLPERLELPPSWGIVAQGHGYQCYPHRLQGEGFYLAALRQTEGKPFELPRLKQSAPRGYEPLPRAEREALAPWLSQPEDGAFFRDQRGTIAAMPEAGRAELAWLSQALPALDWGIEVGSFKNRDFVPAHALALSPLVSDSLPFAELSREDALRFLRKEPLTLDPPPSGWTLARWQGLNLGWMKGLQGRLNNYYPKGWRIRMAAPPTEDQCFEH